jgi:hypothetical protein
MQDISIHKLLYFINICTGCNFSQIDTFSNSVGFDQPVIKPDQRLSLDDGKNVCSLLTFNCKMSF